MLDGVVIPSVMYFTFQCNSQNVPNKTTNKLLTQVCIYVPTYPSTDFLRT